MSRSLPSTVRAQPRGPRPGWSGYGWVAAALATASCQPLPTADQFGYADTGDAAADTGPTPPACGDSLCNGSESLYGCPQDCGGPNRHLGNACTTPGTTAGCEAGYICVGRAALGGGPVCVADFATWPQLPSGHPEGSFVAGKASATDLLTGLTWTHRISAALHEPDATLFCAQADDEGHRDWRLPTRSELHSLVDYNRQELMSLAPGFEWNPNAYCHWSASKAAGGWGSWVVNLWGGKAMAYGDQYGCVVRCVRGTPSAIQLLKGIERYAELPGAETVLDRQTGLQWRKLPPSMERDFGDAIAYCNGLRLQQPGSAWRLPTVRELLELLDLHRDTPCLSPPLAMAPEGSAAFHSGSTVVPHVQNWSVNFANGHLYGPEETLDVPRQTRCVQ